jgi:hypothetical protein
MTDLRALIEAGLPRATGRDKRAGWTLPVDLLCELRKEAEKAGFGDGLVLEDVEAIALAAERRVLAALRAKLEGE